MKLPSWLSVSSESQFTANRILSALNSKRPTHEDFSALISRPAAKYLEVMANKAHASTLKHFGRTISLYTPLYLSNYCSGGCAYCGYAADRKQRRHKLSKDEILREASALRKIGADDILLLTGEETPQADFNYLLESVKLISKYFHNISVESFAMTDEQYKKLADAGCTGITIYQETYDVKRYGKLHRWGPKKDFLFRLGAPERALEAGMRNVGIGVLLGLSDPQKDALRLFLHARYLQKKYWRGGVMVSFPRICNEAGSFKPEFEIDEKYLAQLIFAFRICMPDTPLVLSTRESAKFRDGMAGIGICRMSIASRTTVGGYSGKALTGDTGQFEVNDSRSAKAFCSALRRKKLFPTFKNWDIAFQQKST